MFSYFLIKVRVKDLVMILLWECVISSVLSCRSKNLKCQTSVTFQLQLNLNSGPVLPLSYSSVLFGKQKGKYILETWGQANSKAQFWLLFLYVFYPPPSPSCVNWASQEGCLFHLRFSLQSSDFLFFHFCRFFLSLSFSHCHFGLLFPILTT